MEIKRLKDEIKAKNKQIDLLEKQIADSFIISDKLDQSGVSQVCSQLTPPFLFHVLSVNLVNAV